MSPVSKRREETVLFRNSSRCSFSFSLSVGRVAQRAVPSEKCFIVSSEVVRLGCLLLERDHCVCSACHYQAEVSSLCPLTRREEVLKIGRLPVDVQKCRKVTGNPGVGGRVRRRRGTGREGLLPLSSSEHVPALCRCCLFVFQAKLGAQKVQRTAAHSRNHPPILPKLEVCIYDVFCLVTMSILPSSLSMLTVIFQNKHLYKVREGEDGSTGSRQQEAVSVLLCRSLHMLSNMKDGCCYQVFSAVCARQGRQFEGWINKIDDYLL